MARRITVLLLCLSCLSGLAFATPFTANLRTYLGGSPPNAWLQLQLSGCGSYLIQGGAVYIPRPLVLRPDGLGNIGVKTAVNVTDETTYVCGGAVGTAYYNITIFYIDGNGHTVTGASANFDISGSSTFNLNTAAVKNAYIGAQGPQGPPGAQGPTGLPGSIWYEGAGAPGSGTGVNNDFYLNQTNGDVYQKQSGSWVLIANIRGANGAPGPAGATGATWYTSTGAPSSGLGSNNDFYLNSTNGDVYEKQSGSWVLVANIKGQQGDPGVAGAAGPAGVAGQNGATWFSAAGAPSGGTGVNGDFYLNTTTGDVYKKISGTWTLVGNILGPVGPQGASGGSTTPRGIWASGTAYTSATFDMVTYQGSSFLSVANSTGQAPCSSNPCIQANVNTTYWQTLSLIGGSGTNGVNGSTWFNAAGAPSGGTGINGDYYLNTSNGDVYQKVSGSWTLIGNIKGATGATGATGSTGSNGTNGATWFQGSGVPSSGTGVNGDFDLNTANGDIYQKISGTWTLIGNFKGPAGSAGAAGANGATWSSGTAVPSGGNSGDFYFKTDTSDVYKNTSGVWSIIANIKGATGSTGSTGAAGVNGSTWYENAGVPGSGTGVNGDFYLNISTGDVYQKVSGTWLLIENIKGPAGTASAAGTTKDVQFNCSGSLCADTGQFKYDLSTHTLSTPALAVTGTTSPDFMTAQAAPGSSPTSPIVDFWFDSTNLVASWLSSTGKKSISVVPTDCSGTGHAQKVNADGTVTCSADIDARVPAGPTTPNGVTQYATSKPTGGVAGAMTYIIPGLAEVDSSPTTFLVTYCGNPLVYTGASAVTLTLPTASTLGNTQCVFSLTNNTTGTPSDITVTPTTWSIVPSGFGTVHQGQTCFYAVNAATSGWTARCSDEAIIAGTNVTVSHGQYGITVNSSGGASAWFGSGTDSGAADAYVVTSAMSSYAAGNVQCFIAAHANATTTPTVNFNSLGIKTIVKLGGIALGAGDISNSEPSCLIYDGATFEILNPQSAVGTGKAVLATNPNISSPNIITGLQDTNGNPFLAVSPTGSAVDGVTITNGATGNPATVAVGASGSNSNINLNLTSKGTGQIQINGTPISLPLSLDQIGALATSKTWANGSNTLNMTTTTALSQFLALKNTTAAVVGTSQGSPILSLCGRAFHGSADVEDCLTIGELPGNGNDAAITVNYGHTGSSTGPVTHAFGGAVQSTSDGTHAGSAQVTGNTTEPTLGSNVFAWGGPLSASFTSWGINPASAEPGSACIPHFGAASLHWSAMTCSAIVAADIAANTVTSGKVDGSVCTPGTFSAQTDAATVTWAAGSLVCANASLTFTVHSGSRMLNLTGLVTGGSYVIKLIQDATGGESLTGGTGCTWKQAGGGGSTFTLTGTASAIDVLAFMYDGTNCLATLTKAFS